MVSLVLAETSEFAPERANKALEFAIEAAFESDLLASATEADKKLEKLEV